MSNVIDYLEWRGDVPISVIPFNDVDNLIFSLLSYVDFSDIVSPGCDDKITIEEVARLYGERHPLEEIQGRKTSSRYAPYLLEAASKTRRFSQTRIFAYQDETSIDDQIQFAAVSFQLEDGSIFVSFRGTDDTLVGWKEDFNMSFLYQTPGQLKAVEYLNTNFMERGPLLRIGGHSKGGNSAVYAGCFCHESIQDRILRIYSNDGPGFRSKIVASLNYQRMIPKIRSIVPEDSIIGMMLDNELEHTIVLSDNTGVLAHDGLSWQVKGKDFLHAEKLSDTSSLFDRTISQWVEECTDDERREFVNALYDAMTAKGIETVADFKSSMRNMSDMLQFLTMMPKEQQNNFAHVLKKLAKTSTSNLMKEWFGHKHSQDLIN